MRVGRATLLLLMTMEICLSQGRLLDEENLPSRHLDGRRKVQVYLPPSYERESTRRFPVLYLHDGQNVFSSAGPQVGFGWGNWQLDKTVDELCARSEMREIIMVAVHNSRFRYTEYRGPAYPYTAAELAELKQKPSAPGDDTRYTNYARFLIDELKPKIDRDYRTLPDATHTGVMGSSMGGICSLALAWEYTNTFGLAASLSGAFQVERTNFLRQVLGGYSGSVRPASVYLDSGVTDFSGGDDGRKNTERVAAQLHRIGWNEINLRHFVDEHPLTESELAKTDLLQEKWAEAQTSQHNEFYWRLRAPRALTFLFPPGQK